jgi:hypothetical protein
MSNYTAVANIKTGMIEIRGGSANGTKLYEYPFDEADDVIAQMIDASKQFALMMNNPLLNTERIDEAHYIKNHVQSNPALATMCDWHQHALVLLANAGAVIQRVLSEPVSQDHIDDLKSVYDQIDMVVEANKNHLPQSGPARNPINQEASTSIKRG